MLPLPRARTRAVLEGTAKRFNTFLTVACRPLDSVKTSNGLGTFSLTLDTSVVQSKGIKLCHKGVSRSFCSFMMLSLSC